MDSELLGFWILFILWYSKNQRTQRFRNWTCFRPQVREMPTLFGPLEKANLNHWTAYVYKYLRPGFVRGGNRKICNKNCYEACTDLTLRQ
jgi:PhoPQ-activated pathogenicity-related protein